MILDSSVFLACFVVLLWLAPPLKSFLNGSDHGIPLSLAAFVRMGKVPFVDIYYHYGPLTAYVSALAMQIEPSLVSEVVLCALGYSLALVTIFHILRTTVSIRSAALSTGFALTILGRYYKWFYWFFPMMTFLALKRFLETSSERGRQQWLILAGSIGSLGGLYRMDLAFVNIVFFVLIISTLACYEKNAKKGCVYALLYFLGFAVPLSMWLLFIASRGGFQAIPDYFIYSVQSAVRVLEFRYIALADLFSKPDLPVRPPPAILSVALISLPIFYCLCIYRGSHRARSLGTGPAVKKPFLLSSAGLLGLLMFPQFIQRADLPHLQSAVCPFFLAASLYQGSLSWSTPATRAVKKLWFMGSLLCLMLFGTALAVTSLKRDIDRSWADNFIEKYKQLHEGADALPSHPVSQLTKYIRENSDPADAILVSRIFYQIYYFSGRMPSGNFSVPRTDLWRHRNLEAVKRSPPKFFIFAPDNRGFKESWAYASVQPELFDYLAENYNALVFSAMARGDQRWDVFAKGGQEPGSPSIWRLALDEGKAG